MSQQSGPFKKPYRIGHQGGPPTKHYKNNKKPRAPDRDFNGPRYTQAERIILKFGNPYRLHEAIKLVDPSNCPDVATIYRWTHLRSKGGTGGIIPPQRTDQIILAARYQGIRLTDVDFAPTKRRTVVVGNEDNLEISPMESE